MAKKEVIHPIDFKKTIVDGQTVIIKVYPEPKRKKQVTVR